MLFEQRLFQIGGCSIIHWRHCAQSIQVTPWGKYELLWIKVCPSWHKTDQMIFSPFKVLKVCDASLPKESKFASHNHLPVVVLNKQNIVLCRSSGLVVTGGDSRPIVDGFESQRPILDGHFFTYTVVKIVMFVCKDRKDTNKRPGLVHLIKRNCHNQSIFQNKKHFLWIE